jgi:hypothetical protein
LLFQIALAAFALNHWMAPLAGGLRLHQVPAALAKGLNEHPRYGDRSACRLHPGYRDEAEPAESVAGSGHRDLSLHPDRDGRSGGGDVRDQLLRLHRCRAVHGSRPLFIPLALTKHFYSWFWRWLEGLFAFSMYRVMAAAIGWVWSNLFLYFFVHGVGTDYSLANWLALLPVVFMLAVGFVYSMFKIPALTAALFSGAGSIGQSYISAVSSGVRAAIAAL